MNVIRKIFICTVVIALLSFTGCSQKIDVEPDSQDFGFTPQEFKDTFNSFAEYDLQKLGVLTYSDDSGYPTYSTNLNSGTAIILVTASEEYGNVESIMVLLDLSSTTEMVHFAYSMQTICNILQSEKTEDERKEFLTYITSDPIINKATTIVQDGYKYKYGCFDDDTVGNKKAMIFSVNFD